MEQRAARAELYRLLAAPLTEPDEHLCEAISSGRWAAPVGELLHFAGVSIPVPASFGARSRVEVVSDYQQTFCGPRPLRLVESLYKPWTADPSAEVPIARQKGWLGGDSAAHMQALFSHLGIEIPAALRHAPDHLALELEFLALLTESGSEEQADLFRSQHLDWLGDLREMAVALQVPPFYRDLITLIDALVAGQP